MTEVDKHELNIHQDSKINNVQYMDEVSEALNKLNETDEIQIGKSENMVSKPSAKATKWMETKKNLREEYMKSANYNPIAVPTIDNITSYLKTTKKDIAYADTGTDTNAGILKQINYIATRNASEQISMLIMLTKVYKDYLLTNVNNVSKVDILSLKALYDTLIVEKNVHELIADYNEVFNDLPYEKLSKNEFDNTLQDIELTEEQKATYIATYQKKIREREVRKRINAKPPRFSVGDIVGAQDKEGRWWMSQVLDVFSYLGQHIYYVSFLGWGEQFNEFITNKFKIRWYNPKKHKYYRASRKLDKTSTGTNVKESVGTTAVLGLTSTVDVDDEDVSCNDEDIDCEPDPEMKE